MEKTTSLLSFGSLLIMLVSVMTQTRAKICIDGLGTCENCDERCKAKHGPSSESNCDHSVGVPLCMCYYECPSPPPSPPTPPTTCFGGTGLCSQSCPEKCCDMSCAQKYSGGHGYCNTLDTVSLCLCEYPC